jgi:Zinc carboxypeptidase
MRRIALGLTVTLALAAAPFAAPTASGQGCPSTPTFDPAITSPTVAMPGWPDRIATTTEINNYFEMVDTQSDRVTTEQFGTSVNGTPLIYSLVGTPENVANPEAVAADQKLLTDPRVTTPEEAAQLASTIPAIAWFVATVHGNEQGPANAAIQVMYELAARTDCQALTIRDNLLTGVIPLQNPDGYDAAQRANALLFDMNRDWFAGTQPETSSKLALLGKYPPSVVLVDAHEMGGSSFFFPPNNDPIYHEIAPQSIDWIDNTYGVANAQTFNAAGYDFFNCTTQPSCIYDLFYMGYGDTVPTTAFTTAGMTFEKGTTDTFRVRETEMYTAGWSTISAAANNKTDLLNEYYTAHVNAIQQGTDGVLQPNQLYRPGEVLLEVPTTPLRHYFIPNDRSYSDVAKLLDRLLKFNVEVYQLTADIQVSDLRHYGFPSAPGTVKRGSFWIPMNQPRKHWIQAVMHEDNYVPFPYFYDTTGWSNPQLLNLDATLSGDVLTSVPALRVTRAPAGGVGTSFRPSSIPPFYWFPGDTGMAVAAALSLERGGISVRRMLQDQQVGPTTIPEGAFVVPAGTGVTTAVRNAATEFVIRINATVGSAPSGFELTTPKVGVYEALPNAESFGHLRWLMERSWKVPYDRLTAAQIAGGVLTTMNYDVLIVPGTSTSDLTGVGETQIDSWISAGGIYVGTARGSTGGTAFAISNGYTSSTAATVPGMQIPGTIFRVKGGAFDNSPATLGASSPYAYWYHLGERKLNLSTTGANAMVFPSDSPEFFTSGYATGHDPLKGSAALVDEARGSGRVILFSGEPNYRGFVEGATFFMANSLIYPLGAAPLTVDTASAAAAADVAAAAASAGPETGPGRPIRIEVPAAESNLALAVLHGFTPDVRVEGASGSAFLEIANPQGFDVEEHPFSMQLIPALEAAGVTVRSAIL